MKLKQKKICGCGLEHGVVPDTAILALDAIVVGYYWNCSCGSTLVCLIEDFQYE